MEACAKDDGVARRFEAADRLPDQGVVLFAPSFAERLEGAVDKARATFAPLPSSAAFRSRRRTVGARVVAKVATTPIRSPQTRAFTIIGSSILKTGMRTAARAASTASEIDEQVNKGRVRRRSVRRCGRRRRSVLHRLAHVAPFPFDRGDDAVVDDADDPGAGQPLRAHVANRHGKIESGRDECERRCAHQIHHPLVKGGVRVPLPLRPLLALPGEKGCVVRKRTFSFMENRR